MIELFLAISIAVLAMILGFMVSFHFLDWHELDKPKSERKRKD